jgi:hypothetical protein
VFLELPSLKISPSVSPTTVFLDVGTQGQAQSSQCVQHLDGQQSRHTFVFEGSRFALSFLFSSLP